MTSSIKQNAGFAICVLLTVSLVGCISSITEEQLGNVGDPEVKEKGEKIFIVDHTGKKWDVTHAVEKYGFDPTQFEFGLGPNAIPPIIDPGMLSPGDPNYPDEGGTFVVIGTTIGGESRAYPIHVLNRHEIVDDAFGDVHVAVGW